MFAKGPLCCGEQRFTDGRALVGWLVGLLRFGSYRVKHTPKHTVVGLFIQIYDRSRGNRVRLPPDGDDADGCCSNARSSLVVTPGPRIHGHSRAVTEEPPDGTGAQNPGATYLCTCKDAYLSFTIVLTFK